VGSCFERLEAPLTVAFNSVDGYKTGVIKNLCGFSPESVKAARNLGRTRHSINVLHEFYHDILCLFANLDDRKNGIQASPYRGTFDLSFPISSPFLCLYKTHPSSVELVRLPMLAGELVGW
jgi:hypothetical protein